MSSLKETTAVDGTGSVRVTCSSSLGNGRFVTFLGREITLVCRLLSSENTLCLRVSCGVKRCIGIVLSRVFKVSNFEGSVAQIGYGPGGFSEINCKGIGSLVLFCAGKSSPV